MRPRRSTFVEAAAALAVGFAIPRAAFAQACCVAPSTTGLGRLATYEDAVVGLEARSTVGSGSFDRDGGVRSSPRGAHDLGFEQNLFATGRWLSRGQATLTVPFVETARGANGVSSVGGGFGDVRVALRWDALYANESAAVPGLAVLAGVVLPTGIAPERARGPLGVGATGTGAVQGWGGVAFEKTSGSWLAAFAGLVTLRAPRDVGEAGGVGGATSALPPRWSASLVGAHVWESGFVVSAGSGFAYEGDASMAGRSVPGTSRRSLQLNVGVQVPLGRARFVGSAFGTPPLPAVGAGELATAGLSLAVVVPLD